MHDVECIKSVDNIDPKMQKNGYNMKLTDEGLGTRLARFRHGVMIKAKYSEHGSIKIYEDNNI